jgi:FkbM family methyltransferase
VRQSPIFYGETCETMKVIEVMKYVWSHPANRDRRVRAVARACWWQASKRFVGNPWTIRCYGGLQIRCYPGSNGAGLMIYSNGMIDFDDLHFTRSYLRPGDAFLDIGANIGSYTLLAASCVGEKGTVVAFEPGRRSFDYLQENIRLNGLNQVELHRAAVAESSGEVAFLQTRDLTNRIVLPDQSEMADAEPVRSVTLDEALAGRRFALGKMDVEGAEPMIFRGSKQALQQGNPRVWILELKDRLLTRYGASAREFASFLRNHDYKLASYDATKGQLSFPDEPWLGRENVVAIHTSAIDEVKARLAERR